MIEVHDLVKQFGACRAVDGVSFEVEPGETFALLGPNGSGKTTTLKCMAGLTSPTAGRIQIDGVDVWQHPREAKRRFSFLPQRVAFPEHLSAREVLTFYCRLRRAPLSQIDPALESSRFHLNGSADRPVQELSGGMIQRLGIAVAVLADTPVLLLDEPTVSLDPQGVGRFREFLHEQKQQGRTILFSSHVLADVESLADRVAVLVGGKLAAVESVEALRAGMAARARVRIELRASPERFVPVALDAGATQAHCEGQALVVSARAQDRLAVLRAVEDAAGTIESFSTEEPSLEEIYLGYVHENSGGGGGDAGGGVPERPAPAA